MRSQLHKILIVEDCPILSMEMEMICLGAGYQVVGPASTLMDGLQMATNHEFDVAILDVELVGEQSFPIAAMLLAKGIPFLFCTGCSKEIIPDHFQHALYLSKPVDDIMVLQALSEALAKEKLDAIA
jgi:CheY-like chemotaxis protein